MQLGIVLVDNETSKYKVIISNNAANMMIGHIKFLVGVSIDAANNLRGELIKAAHTLEIFPERNPFFK